MSEIKPFHVTYGSIFNKGNLRSLLIPAFQRNYVWKKTRIEDLINSIYKNNSDFYTGNIMIMCAPEGSADNDYIVDGQQRMVTISLILNYLKNNSDLNKEEISRLLYIEDEPRICFKRKLVNDAYRDMLAGNETIGEAAEFRKLFNTANTVITKKFNDTDISEFYKNLLNINFVIIKLPKDFNVFSIFESLNSKNTPLTPVELTKNTLLGYADNMDKKVSLKIESLWEKIQRTFEKGKRGKEFDTFLRYRSFQDYGHIYSSAVFPKISKDKEIKENPLKFSQDLLEDSKLWLAIREGKFEPSDESQLDSLSEIPAYQSHFKSLNLIQVYSVIFFLHKALKKIPEYKKKNFFENDLKKLLAFSILAKVVGIGPQMYEKIYGNAAHAIATAPSKTLFNKARKEMFDGLNKLAKEEDRKKFSVNLRNKICYKDQEKDKSVSLYENSAFISDLLVWSQKGELINKATIEHIIPKGTTWKDEWGHIKLRSLDERFTLGNFTILRHDKALDLSFEKKLEHYAKDEYSDLEINKFILDREHEHHQVFLKEDPRKGLDKRGEVVAGWIFDALKECLSDKYLKVK